MATEATLVPGSTYHLVTFEDPSFARPLIDTYEFLGKNINGSTAAASGAEYSFRIVDSDGDQIVLTEEQIWQVLDIDGLIQKLNDFRSEKIK